MRRLLAEHGVCRWSCRLALRRLARRAASRRSESEPGRSAVHDGDRRAEAAGARPGAGRLRGLRQREAAAARGLSTTSTSPSRVVGHARHEREHDGNSISLVRSGGRAVPHPAAARRQGDGRRVQRQDRDHGASFTNDRDQLDLATSRTSTSATARGSGTRSTESLDALKGIDGRRVILVFTDGDDTASRVGPGHGARPRARRRSDDLRDWPRERVLQRPADVRSKPDSGLRQAGRGNRRRLLRAEEDGRPRPDLHARRPGAAQPVRARLPPRSSTARSHKLTVRVKQAGNDAAGAPELPRRASRTNG